MAEKMKMRRQLAAPLLPAVPVAKKQRQARAFPPLPLPAVELVSLWGIINAGTFGGTFALAFALYIINPCIPSWMLLLLGIDLTPGAAGRRTPTPADAAKDAMATAMTIVAFVCTVTLAAAATPALLLAPRHRQIRRALAYVVLAAAAAAHCMYVGVLGVYHFEYPVFIRITCSVGIFIFAAGDLLCILALLVGSDDE
ncbi:unnamed protein product [Urochloa decumbens]|uniref:Uncharacterized protein n=1 Tax=Urochloa decumbens TaxID=240449 RepID=A0ABC8YWV7_9POAL